MMYTKLEIAIILDASKNVDEVKKASFWLRSVMFSEKDETLLEFLREASITMFTKLL